MSTYSNPVILALEPRIQPVVEASSRLRTHEVAYSQRNVVKTANLGRLIVVQRRGVKSCRT